MDDEINAKYMTTITLPKIEYDSLIEYKKAFEAKKYILIRTQGNYYYDHTDIVCLDLNQAIDELREIIKNKDGEIKELKDRNIWQRIINK